MPNYKKPSTKNPEQNTSIKYQVKSIKACPLSCLAGHSECRCFLDMKNLIK